MEDITSQSNGTIPTFKRLCKTPFIAEKTRQNHQYRLFNVLSRCLSLNGTEILGGKNTPAYAASKGAIAQLTQSLSNAWSSQGILVNAIAPGYCETDMTSGLIADEVRYKEITDRIPMGRWAKPEEFAGPAVFLASQASSFITGETLLVDGGWMGF